LKSLKFNIWASTDIGNRRLDKAFRESSRHGPIYLFFSVNASGQFCGVARMTSPVDYAASSNLWTQTDKWKGRMSVRWLFVKDIPNAQLRHIRVWSNDNKPVTNSRDTQELPAEVGGVMLRMFWEMQGKSVLLANLASEGADEEQRQSVQMEHRQSLQTEHRQSLPMEHRQSLQLDHRQSVQMDHRQSLQSDHRQSLQSDLSRSENYSRHQSCTSIEDRPNRNSYQPPPLDAAKDYRSFAGPNRRNTIASATSNRLATSTTPTSGMRSQEYLPMYPERYADPSGYRALMAHYAHQGDSHVYPAFRHPRYDDDARYF
jgi:YT521-B-like domain